MNHFIYPGLKHDPIELIAECYKVDPNAIKSKSRKKNIVEARNLAYLVLSLQGNSAYKISKIFQYTHPSILNGLKSIKSDIQTMPFIRPKIAGIVSTLNLVDAYNLLIQDLKKDFWLTR